MKRTTRPTKRSRKNNKPLNWFALSMVGAFSLITAAICVSTGNENTYARPANNGNGFHYEYVTKAECPITSVDVETDTVYVEFHGDEYGYKAEGKIDVTGKAIVTFNSRMEIISVE